MHKDTVHKSKHQVCSYCLGALNSRHLSVGGRNQEELETLKSKDTQFATVKLPKCLEGPHNTYDRSTNSKSKIVFLNLRVFIKE